MFDAYKLVAFTLGLGGFKLVDVLSNLPPVIEAIIFGIISVVSYAIMRWIRYREDLLRKKKGLDKGE